MVSFSALLSDLKAVFPSRVPFSSHIIGPDQKIKGDRACKRCKDWFPAMTNLYQTRCKRCTKTAQFGNKEGGRRQYCADHKEEGMINLGSTKCECGKTANYGVVGGRRTHCAEHKTEGMIDKRTGKSNPGVVPRRAPSPEVVPRLAPKPVVAGTVVEKATAAFVEARAAAVDFGTRSGEREVVDAGTSAPSGRTLGEPTPTAGVFVPSTTLSRAAGAPGEDQGESTAVGAQEEGTWSPASPASPEVSPAPATPSECDGGGEETVARLATRFVGLTVAVTGAGQRAAASPSNVEMVSTGALDVLAEVASEAGPAGVQVEWEGGAASTALTVAAASRVAAAGNDGREERMAPAAGAVAAGQVGPEELVDASPASAPASTSDGGGDEVVARLADRFVELTTAVTGAGQGAGAERESHVLPAPPAPPAVSSGDSVGGGNGRGVPTDAAAVSRSTTVAGDVVRKRSSRVPGTSALESPCLVRLLAQIRANDSAVTVLKLHNCIPADSSALVIDAVLEALLLNSNCQALYIQNQSNGLGDEQLVKLAKVLQRGNIWCLNAGENSGISTPAWWHFVKEVEKTNVTVSAESACTMSPIFPDHECFHFAEQLTTVFSAWLTLIVRTAQHAFLSECIPVGLKRAMRTAIRVNRAKHTRHRSASNIDVIKRCTHMW